MSITEELRNVVESSLQKLRTHPNEQLKPNLRMGIYKAYGFSNYGNPYAQSAQDLDEANFIRSKSDQAICWLSILTARKVLPIWEEAFPTQNYKDEDADWYNSPTEMLQIAQNLLLADITNQEAIEKLCGVFYDVQVDEICTEKVYNVRAAANATLSIAIHGIGVIQQKYSFSQDNDSNVGYSSRDFAAFAARAYSAIDYNAAGMWTQLNKSDFKPLEYDLTRKKEFWEWWLSEAIPQSWELAHNSSSLQL